MLVFEPIHPTYIDEIHFNSEPDEPPSYDCEGHIIPIKTDDTYFWGRHDHEHWRNRVLF